MQKEYNSNKGDLNMKSQTSKVYEDYPEQPYIALDRDVNDWEKYPEKYPYSKVEKNQMIRLKEGVLPGDFIMLWRIGFDNFTNETVIPAYFEYRYGINDQTSKQLLMDLGYMYEGDVLETLPLITAPVLKRILKDKGLSTSGKKDDLVERVTQLVDKEELSQIITLRRYVITKSGRKLLNKYPEIIQKHGPKSL